MRYKIITIGREYGSGGREIGEKLAKKLGIPCYDSEIVEKATIESGLLKEDFEAKGEYLSAGSKLSSMFTLRNLYSNMTKEDKIFHAQAKVIKDLAQEGPCVLVGRCADYILRDRKDVVNVFIFSDMENRLQRIKALHPEENPEKLIREKDKQREDYYSHFTEMNWGEANHYDICLNSSHLGIDVCVDILSSL